MWTYRRRRRLAPRSSRERTDRTAPIFASRRRAATHLRVSLLACVMLCVFTKHGSAKPTTKPDLVAIAAVLLDAGDAAAALDVLQTVDLKDDGVDRVRYLGLLGYATFQLARYPASIDAFEKAVALSRDDVGRNVERQSFSLYLSLAYFQHGDCGNAIRTNEEAGEKRFENPRSFVLLSACAKEVREMGAALAWLQLAQERFPQEGYFAEQEILLFLEQGLFQEAVLVAGTYLEDAPEDRALYTLAAFLDHDAARHIITLGERLSLRFVGSSDVAAFLAGVYERAQRPLSAAQVYARADGTSAAHAIEAAKQYRKAGHYTSAKYFLAKSDDPKQRLRLRLSILLDEKRYEEVTQLRHQLSRSGLLDEDEVRYALAYSQYETRQLDAAEQTVQTIRDPELFRQAAELSRAVATCRAQQWECP